MKARGIKRISAFDELLLLLRQGLIVLLGNKFNLAISLLFPFLAAAITVWIAGENMFVNCESTKSACFILVCAAIWGGLFNSIQTIVKERKNIKRDYVSGALRLGCFTASRALIQLVLCAFQAAVLCLSFLGVKWRYGNELPESGILLSAAMAEYYVSLFLILFAADSMGLMISSFVKNEELASQLSPYVLIVQLLFSGVLFAMEGAAKALSAVMLSRWGMEALGSSSNLNQLPLRLQEEFPMIPHETDEAFLYTAEHLREVWGILALFILVPLVVGNLALHGVKKDGRE